MSTLITCRKHPRYTGQRCPSTDCDTCVTIWRFLTMLRGVKTGWELRYYRSRLPVRHG